jgi:hypothetical protein
LYESLKNRFPYTGITEAVLFVAHTDLMFLSHIASCSLFLLRLRYRIPPMDTSALQQLCRFFPAVSFADVSK